MYGLLLENLSEYIKTKYGEDAWEEIRRLANIDQPAFSTHQVYSETLIPRLAKRAVQVLGVSDQELMGGMGEYFVEFVGQYGYDRVLSVLGRHVRDFLNGLDNLHEYLKFSYPRMRPPSFFCENESSTGMLLHYRSKRKGYAYYTIGQIKQVARHFYNTEMEVELLREEFIFDTSHVTFQLTFDNQAFNSRMNLTIIREEQSLPLKGNMLFEIFPFCILFGAKMVVRYIGNSLMQILPQLVGKKLTDWFDIIRPHVDFKFDNILRRTNNIFELMTVEDAFFNHRTKINGDIHPSLELENDDDTISKQLKLKGQMIYMEEWKMILFLGTPVMSDLDSMIFSGLFINDLSMHDFSRDLMLAGTQQSVELKLALDQEQLKSKKLEESMKKLDDEMRRTDELLYQMIPMTVAQRLRKGENPVDTCETFESVTILFSDVVTFTEICSRITPMEVVSMLNGMYSIFDKLTEKHKVYKVETIGDAYMVVAGAPERQDNHGELVCNMALDMVEAITELTDPSTGNHLRIRVGVHSGMVVAGVVGLKMPRYCLFGDAVNTASRMESTSEAMKVHISQTTYEILSDKYQVEEREEVTVKGKGPMKTYWLKDFDGRVSIKGQMTLQNSLIDDHNEEPRRGSNVSRNYSPITFEDVARRSLTATPTPVTVSVAPTSSSSQASSLPTSLSEDPKVEGDKQRGRTFSNAGFSGVTLPIIDSTPKPSPTDESNLQLFPTHDPLEERVRSTTHEKPATQTSSASHSIHYHNQTAPSNPSTHLQPPAYSCNNQFRQGVPLPDVLMDNQQAHNDVKTVTLSQTPEVTSITPVEERKAGVSEMVDRGTSPIVSHNVCSAFTTRNRVHSHTCSIL